MKAPSERTSYSEKAADATLWNDPLNRRRFLRQAGKASVGVVVVALANSELAVAANPSGNGAIHYYENLVTATGTGVAAAADASAKPAAVAAATALAVSDLDAKIKQGISVVADRWPVGEPGLQVCPEESKYSISGGTPSGTETWSGLTVTIKKTKTNALGRKYYFVKAQP